MGGLSIVHRRPTTPPPLQQQHHRYHTTITTINNNNKNEKKKSSLSIFIKHGPNINNSKSNNKKTSIKDAALTPHTLEQRTLHKEALANLFAELNLAPGPFYGHSAKAEQKDWKLRVTALQSPQVRRLYRNLQKRKQLVKHFSQNEEFSNIFKQTEKSKEDERCRYMLEAALSYSPVELVARNLIDKAASAQQRERHGVWAQLGRAYACLGMPATSIPKEHPTPKDAQDLDTAEEISPFFRVTTKPFGLNRVSVAGTTPASRNKSEQLFACSQAHLKLQCLLLRMGLSHLHDMTHTKFPKKPLEVSDHLRKTVRVNTPFSQMSGDKTSASQSSGSLSQQSIKLADFRAWQRSMSVTPQVEDDNQGILLGSNVQLSKDESPVNAEIPLKGQEVFEWTKQFLGLRKGLQDRLNDKLVAQAIRREQCRSCPPFSAEVSAKLLTHMEETCGRQSPILTQQVWKLAEESQSRKRPTSAPLLPELESISSFYVRVCSFISNQRDDDPLMEVLVHRLKELLESGVKLQKELLSSLCYYMGHLPENVVCTGRMTSVMPILHFICKELRVPSSDYYMLLRNSGLDHFHGNSRNLTSSMSNA